MMKVQRAQEILSASAMINVTYKDVPVFIEDLDRGSEMAVIHPVGEPDNKHSIPVSDLIEQK
jgi:small acid-soluble spore protein H (minor)